MRKATPPRIPETFLGPLTLAQWAARAKDKRLRWPRNGEPWTQAEDDRLLRLFRKARKRYPKDKALGLYCFKNRIPRDVCKELGRTVWAVLARHGMLMLCRCRDKKGRRT